MNEEKNTRAEECKNVSEDQEQLVNDESFDMENNNDSKSSNDEDKQLGVQLKEAQDKYLRLYSDFDNFRKRTQKEKADLINFAAGDVIKDLLGVLDDFERAIQSNENNQDIESIKEGFKLLHHKFDMVLKQKGLSEMPCFGETFDAELHEAITNIPADSNMKGKVVDVVQKGYFLKERVLRYAKVVVGQ
jgi:molecular chaperone GrpE